MQNTTSIDDLQLAEGEFEYQNADGEWVSEPQEDVEYELDEQEPEPEPEYEQEPDPGPVSPIPVLDTEDDPDDGEADFDAGTLMGAMLLAAVLAFLAFTVPGLQSGIVHSVLVSAAVVLFSVSLVGMLRCDPILPESEQESDIGEAQNPVICVFGARLDRDTSVVMLLIIAMWCAIWAYSGLWRTLFNDLSFLVVFLAFIAYLLTSMVTSGTSSGGVVYELNILLTVEQMISILFGTVVLFALFSHKIPVHDSCKPVIFTLTMTILLLLTIASMWVNVWTSGQAFRAVRKFKQGIYNIALCLFVVIAMIFLKGSSSNACGIASSPSSIAR